jgi:CRISPR-associated protein (TIGR03984 family)
MNREGILSGCTIEKLDSESCQVLINWVINGHKPDKNNDCFSWLLSYCHDGVTWGRLNGHQSWQLSSMFFPDLCPTVSESNLLEIRLFGTEREILIWRNGYGFSGRCIIDMQEQDNNTPFCPDDEIRILLGSKVMDSPKEGFTRVGMAGGKEQAVPLECMENDFNSGSWPLRLMIRHYFEEDHVTGSVRLAASRLVNVFKEGN